MTPSTVASDLPEHLAERVRVLTPLSPERNGSYVLYWMHHAVRAHENPALDVAVRIGNAWGLPVLVYQGLGGRHPHNSDRHHTFVMEGARDVQRALVGRNIAYAFHLARQPDLPGPLRQLCGNAALVVTEDFPAPPFPLWTRRMSAATSTAFLAVDAHCIVPMQTVGRSYARAFQFREGTKSAFAQRLERKWSDLEPDVTPYDGTLEFETIDFGEADIADLCAQCDIDHTVGPVPHTPGGTGAGYRRWQQFKQFGLQRYARLRNDAAVQPPMGVSRLSPYLHHGHVSPFRIAREASMDGSAGARKFLDELLIWRELSFNLCFYNNDVESLSALPAWARKTLAQHERDKREKLYTTEALVRGRTGDALWDAAQTSLRIHGELHNNVRMTWGKALLRWTHGPKQALERLIDLNHRFALDGSDPNSYGGILWCLGLFDRPFSPEVPVIGAVRPRSTEQHARRLDLETFSRRAAKPARSKRLHVAVIGAGVSGLIAARTLHDHGISVTVFDKARGPGGRLATRRQGSLTFDHGAQYFTVRDDRFRRYVDAWIEQGVVAEWRGRIGAASDGRLTDTAGSTVRYVGTPRMSALTRYLSSDLEVRLEFRVASMHRDDSDWRLSDDSGTTFGGFDAVILTPPPAQAAPLLADAPVLQQVVQSVTMAPCWAVMASFESEVPVDYDGIFVADSPVSWAARDSSKPERGSAETWVLHGSASWSRSNLEAEKSVVASALVEAFADAVGTSMVPHTIDAHRWRYALADSPLDDGCLWDVNLQIAVCGDWCKGSRVEGAFLSGMAAAGRILGLPDHGVPETVGRQAEIF